MYPIITPHQAEQLAPLLIELSYGQPVRSMLAGHTAGWVWVDQPDHPRLMLAWDGRSNIYLALRRETTSRSMGIARYEDLQQTLDQEVFNLAVLAGQWGYVLQAGPRHQTDPLMRELLRRREALPDSRTLFTMDSETPVPPQPDLAAGLALRLVDEALLADTTLGHHDQLLAWVDENWPTTPAYLEHGFGFALLAPGRLLGWCMAEVVTEQVDGYDPACGIGIEVVEGERRQGYGELLAAAFLAEARARGIQPWWDAWHSNLGSVRLAQKLKLRASTNYGVSFGWYNMLDNAVVHLRMALDRGDSRAAMGWLTRVLERASTPLVETARLWPDARLEQRLLENPYLAAMLARGV